MTNEELVQKYQSGNEEAFDDLLANNEGIIHFMVHKWWNIVRNKKATKEELEAECTLAFYYAAKSYKADMGATFATHAFNKVQWHLLKVFRLDKPKTATGEDVTIISLDSTILGTDDLTIAETVAYDCDLEEKVTEQVTCEMEYAKLWKAVDKLNCRSRDVIYKRYKENKTLDDVAADLLLSRERIRQIEQKALKTLRNMNEVKYLAAIFDYECKAAYRYSLQRFKDTFTSSTEAVALRHVALEEKLNSLEAKLNSILLQQ